jgi:gluconolactonase
VLPANYGSSFQFSYIVERELYGAAFVTAPMKWRRDNRHDPASQLRSKASLICLSRIPQLIKQRIVPEHVALQAERKPALTSHFAIYQDEFLDILGDVPSIECKLEDCQPLFHEAGVYIPANDSVFVTSSRLKVGGDSTILISRLHRCQDGSWTRETIPCGEALMPNGGINYQGKDCVLFCAQGTRESPGGLVMMSTSRPFETTTILRSYYGRWFNSTNDVVFHSDGSIWFTDPTYGYEQGFRPEPSLPSQVYCFNPADCSVRVAAAGFGHPNGLCFSPDEKTMYVTDTDWIFGEGRTDDSRFSHM